MGEIVLGQILMQLRNLHLRRDIVDQIDGLAGDYRGGFKISGNARLRVAMRLLVLMLEQLGLAAAPTVAEGVLQHAPGKGRGR